MRWSCSSLYALGGLQFKTADSDELNYRAGLCDSMFHALGSSHFAVCHYVIRRRTAAALGPVTADDFPARLDESWQKTLAGK